MNKIQVGKKVGEIFETKDYSIFKFRDDNRLVNTNHVKKLANRMKEKGWLSSSVVTLNGSGEVIDGQQRTISICQFVNNDFSVNGLAFHNALTHVILLLHQ